MDCLTQHQEVELEKHCSDFGSSSVSENDECNDDESYIEIALDHDFNGSGSGTSIEEGDGEGEEEEEEEEYELRISISSIIPIPLVEDSEVQDQQNLQFHNHNQSMEMEPILAEPETHVPTLSYSPPNAMPIPLHQTHDHQRSRLRLKFPAVNRLFSTVSFNLRLLWENRQPDHHSHSQTTTQTPKAIHTDTYNNAKTRKQPSMTKTTTNGASMNMMKLFIKFPATKIRTLLASLLKPRQSCQSYCQPNTRHNSTGKTKTIVQCYCYHKRMVNPTDRTSDEQRRRRKRRSNPWDLDSDGIAPSFTSSKGSGRVLEIDLGALRGIFSAVGIGMPPKHTTKRTSCSTSCEPSPIHQASSLSSADNSIQSAVAYCKSSFQQTSQSDFSF